MLRHSPNPTVLTLNSTSFLCHSCPDSASVTGSSLFINQNLSQHFSRTATRRPSIKWKLHSSAPIDDIALCGEDKISWDACRKVLSMFQFNEADANKILGKAFGHIHSPYWYEERKKEVPRTDVINEILNYLRSLNLSNDDIANVLKRFPEVVGCCLEDEVKNNVEILDKQWGITGKNLQKLILRNPKVLGYNVDCKGDCVAKCTRCWVRF